MQMSIRCIDRTDINDIVRLANDEAIARMTAQLPYPYTMAHAETWLSYLDTADHEHVFAVCHNEEFIGVIGVVHEPEHERAELGYWLGQPYWNKGYMTAAADMAIAYAFTVLGVQKIYARCFSDNPGSARVLEKNGFVREGFLKDHCIRMGQTKDVLCYGLLKGDT